jgi:hypothetical protein
VAVTPLLQVHRTSEEGRSPLADELHSKERTGVEDLAVVLNLFTHYRTRFQGYPVGEDNATFVNALTGAIPVIWRSSAAIIQRSMLRGGSLIDGVNRSSSIFSDGRNWRSARPGLIANFIRLMIS